jgi:hypothetical protein
MVEFNGTTCPPTEMDKIAMGADCVRHGLLGCIISNNGSPPIEQARNYLRSLRQATADNVTGRSCDMSDAEFREWMVEAGSLAPNQRSENAQTLYAARSQAASRMIKEQIK